MLKYLLAIAIVMPSVSHAFVDMRNANYSDTWIDLLIPGTGYDLKIRRTYNSRSLYNGLFGFGMCSNLETSIQITPEGNIKLIECGAGMEVVYTPRKFSPKAYSNTIDKIIAKMKRQKRRLQPKYIANLKKELFTNEDLRNQYAKEYGIAATTPNGTRFYAGGRGVESFTYSKGYYTRRLPDGTAQQFDKSGHMVRMIDQNGNHLTLAYNRNKVTSMSDRNGRKLSFSYYPNGKVKSIVGPNNKSVSYKYKKQIDLVWVKMGDDSVYQYQYDALHNITKVVYPDKKTKTVRYDTNRDWVLAVQGRDGCREDYKYVDSKDDPKNHYWATLTKKCGKEVVSRGRFEFWYKKDKIRGSKYLARTKMELNGQKQDVSYDSTYGRPLRLTQNGRTTHYTYYSDGLIKTKKIGKSLSYFKYNKKRKVSQVKTGKLLTRFQYDGRGNLTFAKNSRGQYVRLKYDNQGRISSIVDQAKRKVNIAYESRFGKPRLVERPGIGAIKISYKSNGQVDKVTPKKGGPTIAVQVASTFNNLLDIIAPAGVDLGI
jgi:YD repeat-containing protein